MVKKAINITKPRKKFNGQILRPKLLKSGNQNVATRKCSGGRDQPWINARSECQPLIFTPTNVSPPFNLFLFSSSSITHFPYALQNLGISLFLLLSDFVGFFFWVILQKGHLSVEDTTWYALTHLIEFPSLCVDG